MRFKGDISWPLVGKDEKSKCLIPREVTCIAVAIAMPGT